MDGTIDRLARWLAKVDARHREVPQTRRRFIQRGAQLGSGLLGSAILGRTAAQEVAAEGAGIESHLTRDYRACDKFENCGECIVTDTVCAAYSPAPGGGSYCYQFHVQDSLCGVNGRCDQSYYCSRSTWWGSRCYGPAGCV
jgi:hypothetical protein